MTVDVDQFQKLARSITWMYQQRLKHLKWIGDTLEGLPTRTEIFYQTLAKVVHREDKIMQMFGFNASNEDSLKGMIDQAKAELIKHSQQLSGVNIKLGRWKRIHPDDMARLFMHLSDFLQTIDDHHMSIAHTRNIAKKLLNDHQLLSSFIDAYKDEVSTHRLLRYTILEVYHANQQLVSSVIGKFKNAALPTGLLASIPSIFMIVGVTEKNNSMALVTMVLAVTLLSAGLVAWFISGTAELEHWDQRAEQRCLMLLHSHFAT